MSKVNGVENNDIEMVYKVKDDNEQLLQLFSKPFVDNNIGKCKIIYNENEYELKQYFEEIDDNYKSKDLIKITLSGINNITNLEKMFDSCYLLLSIKIGYFSLY